VINRAGATTALYVDSFIAPRLQELGHSKTLSQQNVDTIQKLLTETSLGKQIIAFKVWDLSGRVLFSDDPQVVDKVFPMSAALIEASQGKVSSRISVEEEENATQRQENPELLEIYSPVRLTGTNQVIAVAEYYQITDELRGEINTAQRNSWLVVSIVMFLIYLALSGFVRSASNTIDSQQQKLNHQIVQLQDLLAQNKTLSERVRRAASQVSATHEHLLRRVGADLHDGPAQDLGLALLQIDTVIAHFEQMPGVEKQYDLLARLQALLQGTLQEMRAIATGFSLPQLSELGLRDTFTHVVRAHERRAEGKVELLVNDIPENAALPIKIAVYRIVQEALTNAQRYSANAKKIVRAHGEGDQLVIEIMDEGQGFDPRALTRKEGHMGLLGMRERVESLGGQFQLESAPGSGTRIQVKLPLFTEGETDE
jgi:signal transduction histidine kinase